MGIDLGTTNSAVGVVDSGFPILLADEGGRRLMPSAVYFPEVGEPVVGEAALRARGAHPGRVVTSVKRLMGSEVEVCGRTAVEVSALILRGLKAVAERALDGEVVGRAVITVPAYFNDAQRHATKQAGELAGLQVDRIVSEPTAAALAYGLDKLGDRSKVAVFDFGGGTFDLSVLEFDEGVFRVLSTHGDTRLGGDDIDAAVAAFLAEEIGGNLEAAAYDRLLVAVQAAKVALSSAEETTIRVPFLRGDESFERRLGRAEFERVAAPVWRRTVPHCRQALSDAGLGADALQAVVLVGGSSRIPAVRALVAEVFGREPDTSQNPDEAVAMGAVIQAGVLSGALREEIVLLDVTPLSLGIETFGGLMNVIIPRNTTIPTKAGEMFTNAVANQESMLIRVLQGERELAKDNWGLGEVAVPFPPGAKGSARVGVQFRLDENGILEVLARDTATGNDTVLHIEAAAIDVDDQRVEQMISESVDHAFEDMHARILSEEKLKADELLAAVGQALALADEHGLLEAGERSALEAATEDLRGAAERGDVATLKGANERLDRATQALAAKIVEVLMVSGER